VAEGETSSTGGVILTSQSADKPTIGEVVAVGPGKKDEDGKVTPVNCKPGEQVSSSSSSVGPLITVSLLLVA
jgi:chaperonin GroES